MHQLHIVCGLPASGKTTYARQLSKKIGAAFFDSDTVTNKVIQAAHSAAGIDPNDRDSVCYKQTYRNVVYETLFDLAAQNLPHVDVVLAGPFTQELEDLNSWKGILHEKFGRCVKIHHMEIPEQVRTERMRSRDAPRDVAKLKHRVSELSKN